ncbi:hypothetical protein [Sphingomonas sp.]|uniref:hypothetical protein n=1 Tax=Sphingomonas sp. TaxID=28214 RepID=UPI002DD69878|nr:hypothetical protein [Sphingomonas sp.]
MQWIIPARLSIALAAAGCAAFPALATQIVAESGQVGPSYAAVAGRVLGASAVIDATIRSATRLKPEESPGLRPGHARFYVTADVGALIRGPAGVATRISYLADVPLDFRGRPPKLRKARVLLFARTVPGRPAEVQLTAPDAQLSWTPALDALVRTIAREVVAADAPPAITGVGNAFHVAGTLPGEGETQIFLNTADSRPVSLSILRRPGEQRRWAVALSEIVDEAAGPPPRDTLLWYRLACGLPPALPARSVVAMEPADAAVARADYQFVLRALGPCR